MSAMAPRAVPALMNCLRVVACVDERLPIATGCTTPLSLFEKRWHGTNAGVATPTTFHSVGVPAGPERNSVVRGDACVALLPGRPTVVPDEGEASLAPT